MSKDICHGRDGRGCIDGNLKNSRAKYCTDCRKRNRAAELAELERYLGDIALKLSTPGNLTKQIDLIQRYC